MMVTTAGRSSAVASRTETPEIDIFPGRLCCKKNTIGTESLRRTVLQPLILTEIKKKSGKTLTFVIFRGMKFGEFLETPLD
jgi:hypothetical protein